MKNYNELINLLKKTCLRYNVDYVEQLEIILIEAYETQADIEYLIENTIELILAGDIE